MHCDTGSIHPSANPSGEPRPPQARSPRFPRSAATAASTAILLLATLALTACHEPMIATPHVMYGDRGRQAFAQTPEAQRTPDMRVLYVTDRMPEPPIDGKLQYGYGRSPAMEYGVATCTFGADVTWDELVDDSVQEHRKHEYRPRVVSVEKTGTMLPIVSRMQAVDGVLVPKSGALEQFAAEQAEFNKTVALWLDHAERKEAVVFIHGFNNSFDEAVLRLAQAWHFTGRQGVPIVFTWPAGSPGLLSGYQHDRESGEFANLHLKLLLIALARDPQIERIHIIAHSRGTDVAITAVRELHAEIRGGLGASIICSSLGIPNPTGQAVAAIGKRKHEFHRSAQPHRRSAAGVDIDAEAGNVARLGQGEIDQPGWRGKGIALGRRADPDRVAIDDARRKPVDQIEVEPVQPDIAGIDRIEPAHVVAGI